MSATPTATPRREPLRRDQRAPARRRRLRRDRAPPAHRPAHRPHRVRGGGHGRRRRDRALRARLGAPARPTTRPDGRAARARRLPRGRGAIEVALGMGLVTLAFLLTMRALGDLVLRRDRLAGRAARRGRRAAVALSRCDPRRSPPRSSRRLPEEERRERTQVLSRNGVGATLVIAAGIVFLSATHALTAARDVILAVLVVAARARDHLRALGHPPGALARRRARGAHPLAGARRDGGAPARLGPADARARAEARRRPARGGRPGPHAGARAARVARRARGRPRPPRRRARGRGRRGRARARRAGGDRGRRRPRARRARRGARGRRARGDGQRGEVRRRLRRSTSTPRPPTTRCRSSCATAARASIPPRCPPTAAACASRSSGAWPATAGAPRSTRRPARAPRSS